MNTALPRMDFNDSISFAPIHSGCFFSDLTEAQASDLADRIISLGNENVFGSDAWFGSNAVPPGLFYRDGVGIYPYFAIGDWERFCIIPVTAERLQEFKEKGVVLYALESPS